MTTDQQEQSGNSHGARISDGPGDLYGGMQLDMHGTRRDASAPEMAEPEMAESVIFEMIVREAFVSSVTGPEAATGTLDTTVDDDAPVGSSFARCADGNGTLTHLFFSDDEFDIARAKAICSRCGRAETCLAGALDRVEPYGVWGGKLVIDGVIVEVKRGRGRPPKTPRPPLVVDEVPLPPHLVA